MVSFRMASWIQRSLGLRPRFKRIRRRKIAGLSRGAMSAQVISLETRILPAAATNLADMNGDPDYQNDSSNAREYTTIGDRTFFTYNTQVTNKPILAFTDATNGVTTMLPDQTNFRFSPNTQISELTVFQGKLLFVATDGNASMALGQELWSYDPNTGVFACVTDFDGAHATNVNGVANSGINAKQTLTDGTTTNNVGKNEGSAPRHLTVSNNKLYFTATNDLNGLGANRELYVYDGAGVTLLKDINPSAGFNSGSSDPQQLTNANDVYLYFTAVDAVTNGRELWRTDGTLAGTIALTDNGTPSTPAGNIRPGGQSPGVTEITPAGGGVVYFSANDGVHGYELWKSDGNANGDGNTTGTFMVRDIQPIIAGVNQGSNPSSLLFSNGILYFGADDGTFGKELWMSTGAKGNATLVSNIAKTGPGGVLDDKQNSNPHNLTDVGGKIYFSANDGLEGFELWKYDPATSATAIVNTVFDPVAPGPHQRAGINQFLTSSGDSSGSSYPGSLLNVGGNLFFVATSEYDQFGQTNFELYRVDASGPFAGIIRNAGTEKNFLSNQWQSQFDIPDPQQDFTYSKARADGFRPTEVIQDKSPTGFRTNASNEQLFLGPDGLIYFAADNGANGSKVGALGEYNANFEPWVYNSGAVKPWIGSNASTIVKDLTVQALVSTDPFGFTTVAGRTYFFFSDPRLTSKHIGLAYTDGTTGGTIDTGLRFDSIGTANRPDPQVFGNSILFIANGREVWKTNGTFDGTEAVGVADVSIDYLTVSGSRFFYIGENVTFSGNIPSYNAELWSGTTGAATQVLEIAPTIQNFNNSTGTQFIVPGPSGSVFFNADDFGAPNNGSRNVLWISNGLTTGNPTGTRIVVGGGAVSATKPTGPEGPRNPYAAASAPGGAVYFAAGTQLFRSTVGGDQAFIDLNTYALSNAGGLISSITPVAGGVFFVSGNTLFFSDGTTANVTTVVGAFGNPSNLTAANDRLYFSDNGGTRVWMVSAAAPNAPTMIASAVTNVHSLEASGNNLYFSARTPSNGQELWFYNGALTQVPDVQAGAADSLNVPDPADFHSHVAVTNGRVFYGANDPALGEFVRFTTADTTNAPTSLRDIIRPTTASSNARDFIVVDADSFNTGIQPGVFFFSDVGPNRSVLSQVNTDPNDPSGTLVLTNVGAYRDIALPFFDDFAAANSQIDLPSQYLNWGEYLVNSPVLTGIFKAGNTATANFAGYLGTQYMFFAGITSERTTGGPPTFAFGLELYVLSIEGDVNGDFLIDNRDLTQTRIEDLRVAAPAVQGNANPGYLTSIGNNADGQSTFVLFAASNGPQQGSLWRVTTAASQPGAWTPTQVSSAAVNPRYLQSLGGGQTSGGKVYFTAGAEGNRTAWVTDGNTATQLSTAIVDESAGDGKIFGFSNGKVYFSAREAGSGADNFELYQTDHASGTTALFAEINTGAAGSRPGNFTDVNGKMYFAANDGVNGFELWSTDGVTASIVKSLDSNGNIINGLEPGAAGSNPGVVISTETDTDLNGVSTTRLVYTYEGFAVANTRPDEFGVANAGFNPGTPANPSKQNSGDNNGTPTLMFAATTTKYGRELFQVTPDAFFDETNPTGNPLLGMPVAGSFTRDIGGTTYLFNPGHAQLVKDIAPGVRSSNPLNLTGVDGTVYMSADDGLSGDTLWRSIGLDQVTGNALTVKLTDDASLFAGNSALINGIRNPNDFTFLSTNNKTLNRLIFTAGNDLGKTEVYTLNINHTPTALNLSSNAVPENQPQGTLVGSFVSTDPDFGDSFQYKFVNGAGDTDNNLFQIIGTTLQIKGQLDFEQKNQYTVRIRTTDQRGQFYERTFTVNVSDVNEAPGDLRFLDPVTNVDMLGNGRIDEVPSVAPTNPPPTSQDILLANLDALSDDAITANNVFSIVPGQLDANSFVLDTRNGRYQLFLKAGTVLNFENKGTYEVNVQIVDPSVANSVPVVRKFTLTLNDLNESPIGPVSDSDSTADSVGPPVLNGAVDENSATGTTVGITALAVDPDTQLNPVTYTLDDNAGNRFQIDPVTGVVSVLNGGLLNYEGVQQYSIIVRGTSSDTSFSTATFNIQILDVDEFDVGNITDVDAAPNQVEENAATGTPVGITAFAVDNDGSNSAVTYSLYSNAGGAFQIDPNTGVITVLDGSLLNREVHATRQILVQATSQDGSISYQNFVINILDDILEHSVSQIFDLNPAPEVIPEHSPTGTPVGITAFAYDSDATNNQVTYSLFNTRQGRFAIDSQTGVVTVANGTILDAEAQSVWTITVLATSQDGSISTRNFTIQLSDVDEFDVGAVFDLDNAVNTVNENAPDGTTVGITAFAIDLDPTASITYTLVDNAGGRFAINNSTGVVTVANGLLLNREAAAQHQITVLASSTDGSTSQKNFQIAVNDVNEFDLTDIGDTNQGPEQVLEHAAVGTPVGVTAFARDNDATNNQVTYSLTDNAGGLFAINPTTGVVTVANSALLDREVAEFHTITVKATSADTSSKTRSFTIKLLEVNDNQVTNIVDSNPTSDGNLGGVAFNGNVNEKAATGTLVGITAFATDADVGANRQITYSLQDTSGGRYKIDPLSGVVSVDDGTRIDFEAGNTNLIIVKATSDDGSFKTKTFTITVNDVFEQPEITMTNQSVNENMAAGAVVGVFGVQNALPTSPVYTLVSGTGSTNNASFQIVGNQLRTKASFNFETKSSYSVRVKVTSANGITTQKVFIITVKNVNEAPTGIALSKTSVRKTSPVGTVVGLLSATDVDAGNTFTYSLVPGTGSTDNAKFAIVGNQLRVNAPLGSGTRASIRVRVTDQNGLTYEKTFTISLTN